MDFKNFKKNRPTESTNSSSTNQEDIRKTAEQYAGKSEEELLAEIFRLANENKRNGTLSASQLDEFERNVMPMLNREQRKRLESVLGMLRH